MNGSKIFEEGKTLVLCPIGLGNFLMVVPALKALSAAMGSGRIDLLALKPSIAQMATASGLFGKVHAWDPDREGLVAGLKLLLVLRRRRFSHSLALFPTSHWKFSVFQYFIGAKSRRGFAYPHQRSPMWVQHHSLPLESTHDVYQNLRLVYQFLGEQKSAPPSLVYPGPVENPTGLPSAPFFACHPGSSAERGMAEKRLPPESFAELIRKIHAATGMGCVLVGGPEERELNETVAAGCREAILPVAIKSLAETAGVLKSARFLLCNDSGLMHLAVAVGTRCAAFFGPTDEKRTGPFGYWEDTVGVATRATPTVSATPRHLILRKPGLECAPCWTLRTVGKNPPCIYGDTRCLRDYSVDEVWKKLAAWIATL